MYSPSDKHIHTNTNAASPHLSQSNPENVKRSHFAVGTHINSQTDMAFLLTMRHIYHMYLMCRSSFPLFLVTWTWNQIWEISSLFLFFLCGRRKRPKRSSEKQNSNYARMEFCRIVLLTNSNPSQESDNSENCIYIIKSLSKLFSYSFSPLSLLSSCRWVIDEDHPINQFGPSDEKDKGDIMFTRTRRLKSWSKIGIADETNSVSFPSFVSFL